MHAYTCGIVCVCESCTLTTTQSTALLIVKQCSRIRKFLESSTRPFPLRQCRNEIGTSLTHKVAQINVSRLIIVVMIMWCIFVVTLPRVLSTHYTNNNKLRILNRINRYWNVIRSGDFESNVILNFTKLLLLFSFVLKQCLFNSDVALHLQVSNFI